MKKLFILTFITLLIIPQSVWATSSKVTPTAKVSPAPTGSEEVTPEDESDTIQKIKEMVANKVSKLNLIEKRGIMGTVKEVSTTQITIETTDKSQRFIDIDELTKFQETLGSSKSFGISDIEKGDVLAFVGNFNKDTRRLLARYVTKTSSIPLNYDGVISEINSRSNTFTLVLHDGTEKTIDVETSTKTYIYDQEDGESRSGFSKLEEGQRTIVVGFADTEEEDTVKASRVTHFTTLPPSPEMKQHAEIPEEELEAELSPSPTSRSSR